MTEICELLESCGFFTKYKETKNLVCNGFIQKYCKGSMMDQCKRKKFFLENGKPASIDMMPSGREIKN